MMDLEKVKQNCGKYERKEISGFGVVGVSEMQGRRPSMEDAHSLHLAFQEFWSGRLCEDGHGSGTPSISEEVFLGIYDGHGGSDAAKYTHQRLHLIFASKLQKYYKLRQSLDNLMKQKEEFTESYLKSAEMEEQQQRLSSTSASPSSHENTSLGNPDTIPNTSTSQVTTDSSSNPHLDCQLQSILAEIIELKFHFSELVKRVSYQVRAPEIEHVIDEDEDDDSSEGWDSDDSPSKESSSSDESGNDPKNDNILVEESVESLQLELYSEQDAIQLLLRESFLEVNDEMRDRKVPNGCTASVVYMNQGRAYAANVGDSRVVLCRNGQPIRLSVDHRPSDPAEKERIRNVGGYVNGGRVNGILAVTRALGDCFLEPMVTADPTTMVIDLHLRRDDGEVMSSQEQRRGDSETTPQHEKNPDTTTTDVQAPENQSPPLPDSTATTPRRGECDDFLIVACDGLWDFVSDEKAIEIAQEEQDPRIAAVRLRNFAYQTGSTDNISVCVFRFANDTQPVEMEENVERPLLNEGNENVTEENANDPTPQVEEHPQHAAVEPPGIEQELPTHDSEENQ